MKNLVRAERDKTRPFSKTKIFMGICPRQATGILQFKKVPEGCTLETIVNGKTLSKGSYQPCKEESFAAGHQIHVLGKFDPSVRLVTLNGRDENITLGVVLTKTIDGQVFSQKWEAKLTRDTSQLPEITFNSYAEIGGDNEDAEEEG